jgi:hypothetical protein
MPNTLATIPSHQLPSSGGGISVRYDKKKLKKGMFVKKNRGERIPQNPVNGCDGQK